MLEVKKIFANRGMIQIIIPNPGKEPPTIRVTIRNPNWQLLYLETGTMTQVQEACFTQAGDTLDQLSVEFCTNFIRECRYNDWNIHQTLTQEYCA